MSTVEEQKLLTCLDQLFPFVPAYARFSLNEVIEAAAISQSEKQEALSQAAMMENYLVQRLKYATGSGSLELTDKGRQAKDCGGHLSYATKLKLIAERQEQKEFADLHEATVMIKSYPATRVLAICAFGIALFLLVFKIAEWLKG